MKKLLIIIILCVLLNAKNYAQSASTMKDKFLIGWEVAVPSNDLISGTSWSGGRFDYRHMIKPNLSVGVGVSWNSFSDYVSRTTYQKADGTGALTTDLVKDVYTVPITLETHYYFKGKKLLPYVGIGLGTEYSDQTLYFNIYSIEEDNWGFVARPEVGVIFPFNSGGTGLYLNGAYNYASNKNETFGTNSLSHFAVSLGFTF